MTDVVKIEGLS